VVSHVQVRVGDWFCSLYGDGGGYLHSTRLLLLVLPVVSVQSMPVAAARAGALLAAL
jgi:hypothetical protein